MDVSRFVLLNVALASVAGAVGSLRDDGGGRRAWDWLALELTFAVVGALGWWRYPGAAPVVSTLFVALTVVPLLGMYAGLRLASSAPRLALAIAALAYGLHPLGRTATHWRLVRASSARARGVVDEDPVLEGDPVVEHVTALAEAKERFDWEDIATRCSTPHPRLGAAEQLYGVFPLYLRALGELGRLDRMVAAAEKGRAHWEDDDEARAVTALFVAAFCGRAPAVDALLSGPLAASMSPGLSDFWRATARVAAGSATDDIWRNLAASDEPRVAAAADDRLRRGRTVTAAPEAAVDALLAEILASSPARRPPVGSLSVGALLLVAHLVAELGDRNAWLRRAIFWSPWVREGQWWRLLSSGLVHGGWLHLGLNLLGLFWFGRIVERALGPIRSVATVLLGVLGGSLAALGLVALGVLEETAMIGASGGVMALLGVTLALAVRRWRRADRGSLEQVGGALGMVALQVVSDLVTPEVSLAGHAGGLITGVVLGLLFAPPVRGPGRRWSA